MTQRDKAKEPDTYWAGDTVGKQCDVPECPNFASITKHSQTDEKIRLCHQHRDLTPETVLHWNILWLESF